MDKPNSHRSKEEEAKSLLPEKKVSKVIVGTVRQRKKSELSKFTDIFISKDVDSVKSYVLLDVLVPAVKKAISDIVTNGIDMLLYGESRGKSNGSASKISYRSYYDSKQSRDRGESSYRRAQTGYGYDDIIFDNRGEAESVLMRMDELIDVYRVVSVGDLYDMAGITGNYTDNKYGWTDIHSAEVVRVRDGYIIKLPKAMPLD